LPDGGQILKRFTIDGRNVASFDDFVVAVNLGFIRHVGGTWNGNLDAFNDYLSWPEEPEYELELLGGESCGSRLGHAAQAAWLRATLGTCHSSSVADMQARLARAEAGDGETLFDVIRAIVARHPQVHLVLR
jgi:hypothetical protein